MVRNDLTAIIARTNNSTCNGRFAHKCLCLVPQSQEPVTVVNYELADNPVQKVKARLAVESCCHTCLGL